MQKGATNLSLDNMLVHLAGGDVVVPSQSDIEILSRKEFMRK